MNDEILHRIEHKLDAVLTYLRNSSLARQGDSEARAAVDNYVPALPNQERVCPVCTHFVTITPDPQINPVTKTLITGALKRNCGCPSVVTVR